MTAYQSYHKIQQELVKKMTAYFHLNKYYAVA